MQRMALFAAIITSSALGSTVGMVTHPLLLASPMAVIAQHIELWAHTAGVWLTANPTADVGLALFLGLGILNKLQGSPWAAQHTGFIAFMRKATDLLGALPHAGAYGVLGGLLGKYLPASAVTSLLQALFGWFNVPFAPSFQKDGTVVPTANKPAATS